MMRLLRHNLRPPAAIIGGTTITSAAIWLLGVLNDGEMPERPAPQHIRSILFQNAEYESIDEHDPQPTPQLRASKPEPMELKTQPLPRATVAITELDLALQLPVPIISDVKVRIAPQPQKPAALPTARLSTPAVFRQASPAASNSKPVVQSAPIVRGKIDQPPMELAGNAAPEYPAREDQLGVEGAVLIHILIDETGRVEDVRPIRGLEAFKAAVVKSAFAWRFSRPRHRGQAVKVWRAKEVKFRKR